MKLKEGQEVFFIVRDEDKRELTYRKGTFLYSASGGHRGKCMIATKYNGQDIRIPLPRRIIFASEKEVRDEVFLSALIHGWRAAI